MRVIRLAFTESDLAVAFAALQARADLLEETECPDPFVRAQIAEELATLCGVTKAIQEAIEEQTE